MDRPAGGTRTGDDPKMGAQLSHVHVSTFDATFPHTRASHWSQTSRDPGAARNHLVSEVIPKERVCERVWAYKKSEHTWKGTLPGSFLLMQGSRS